MRAKVSVVTFVILGLLGAVVVTASAADTAQVAGEAVVLTTAGDTLGDSMTPADRGNGHDHDSEGKGDPECIAEEEAVVGPVCVEVEDVISDILST